MTSKWFLLFLISIFVLEYPGLTSTVEQPFLGKKGTFWKKSLVLILG